jgi:AraC-like DNA-binding protein
VTATTSRLTEDSLASVVALARAHAPSLQVADLADHAGYSPFHFSRMFSAQLGIGPGQYLIALRVARAKELLLAGEDPVIDVACEVGFDSVSSFSRRFRSTVGIAPGQLRRLADTVAERPPRPFALLRPHPVGVRAHLVLPEGADRRGDPSIWVGWYPHPAPIGLPASGLLVSGVRHVELPLCEGAPFLLAFAVPAHADPLDMLAPAAPLVAAHPRPLHGPGEVTLRFGTGAAAGSLPMLSALPVLCRA